jgi:S1-C subfamily serine protease
MLTGHDRGVEVTQVVDGSPAATGGVLRGDVVVDVDGVPVTDVADLQRLMTSDHIGVAMSVTVLRSWEPVVVSVTPHELSD